mmetsp:Transcript_5559/g.17966  ORF Transcript_5559/g.17966 Transcript_5559/m.17966 type:complete len:247 (-) Transcript_5559:439-1179(-)
MLRRLCASTANLLRAALVFDVETLRSKRGAQRLADLERFLRRAIEHKALRSHRGAQGSPDLEHLLLHVHEELLLRSQNAARSANAVPADKGSGGEAVVLHCIKPNESAGSSKPGLAVHGHRARLILGEAQELRDDLPRWATPVGKVEVRMPDAVLREPAPVVLLVVQADNQSNVTPAEDGHAVLGREARAPCLIAAGRRGSREGEKLLGHHPRGVALVDVPKKVVRGQIKLLNVEPTKLDCLLHTL